MSCSARQWKRKLPLYESGVLTPAEERRLDAHLLACPDCAEELYHMIPVIAAVREMEAPALPDSAPDAAERWWVFRWVFAAAAIVVVAVFSVTLILLIPKLHSLPPATSTADINRIFEAMDRDRPETYPADLFRNPLFIDALKEFQAGRYEECWRRCQGMLENQGGTPGVVILAARAGLALNRPRQVQQLLERYPVTAESDSYSDYLWIKALTLLRQSRRAETLRCLRELAAKPGPNQAGARELLDLLEGRKPR